jgi:16S rRNA processing protein RimM
MEYIEIGQITNTYGIKGQIKIKSYTNLDRFKKNSIIYILFNNEYIKEKVKSNTTKDGFEIVKLFNYDDINLVEKYKGCTVFITKEQQLPLEDGFYYHELIGKKIINQNDELRAEVVEVRDYSHCDMLVVKLSNGKTKMIPFVDEFILEVNDDSIIINEIDGLL